MLHASLMPFLLKEAILMIGVLKAILECTNARSPTLKISVLLSKNKERSGFFPEASYPTSHSWNLDSSSSHLLRHSVIREFLSALFKEGLFNIGLSRAG